MSTAAASSIVTASAQGIVSSDVVDHRGVDEPDNAHLTLAQDQYMQFNAVQQEQHQQQQQEFPLSVGNPMSSNVGGQFTNQLTTTMAPYSNFTGTVATAAVSADDGTVQWSGGQYAQQATNAAPPGNTVPQFGGSNYMYTDNNVTNQFATGGQLSNITSHNTEMFTSAPPFSHGDTKVPPANENFNLQVSGHSSEQTLSSVPSVSEASYNYSAVATSEQPAGLYPPTGHPMSNSFLTSSGPMQPAVTHSTAGVSQAVPFQPPTQPSTQEKKLSSEKEISKGALSVICY